MKLHFSPALIKKATRWGILLIGLTVAVTVGISVVAGTGSLSGHLANLPASAIWWLVAATVVESFLRFWRYQIAAKALYLGVPWYRLMYYYTVGYALIPTPGKIGTAIRLWLLKQYHGLSYSRTAPLLVMDLVSDTLAMCMLVVLSLLVLDDSRLATLGIIVGCALLMALLATLVAPHLMVRSVKFAYAVTGRRRPRLFARLLTLMRTTATILGSRVLLTTTALSFVGWGLVGIAVGHLVNQFGVATFGTASGTLAITLSTMGGFLTMMPAGVGGAEVTMAGLFTLFGVTLSLAVLVTAIVRLIVLWSTVLIGLVLLPVAIRNTPPEKHPAPRHHRTKITVIETNLSEYSLGGDDFGVFRRLLRRRVQRSTRGAKD